MRITLYRNESDSKQINKNLKDAKTIEGVLKDGCSITHPIFKISRENASLVYKFNYLQWHEGNRYYFVDNVTYETGGVAEISCTVDVLMTYNQYITDLTTVVERQESIYNPYLEDSGICITQGSIIKAIDVGQVGDTTYTCYMTTIGAVTEMADEGGV